LVKNIIFTGHDMSGLFSLYLEFWISYWRDPWVVEKLIKLSTFHMFDSRANAADS